MLSKKNNNRIYINGKFFSQELTGVQRYARELLNALDRELAKGCYQLNAEIILLVPPASISDVPKFEYIQVVAAGIGSGHLWEQVSLPWIARGFLLLNCSGSAPLIKLNQICTVHDLAIYDCPHAYKFSYRSWYKMLYFFQSILCKQIWTSSQFSKNRIIELLKVSPGKIAVIYGASNHFERAEAELLANDLVNGDLTRYFLAVGSMNPTKNFKRLIHAFSKLTDPAIRLLIVGGKNVGVFSVFDEESIIDSRVVFVGRVSDGQLRALYENALAFVFPSTYEGFGLPPLEAMWCGCAVIASTAASIPEVCGKAAMYIKPFDEDSIVGGLEKAISDRELISQLRGLSLVRSRSFSWEGAARKAIKLLFT
jgi:glycosyltransferase involved in cell wall biosynthesis